jgi:nitroreductase
LPTEKEKQMSGFQELVAARFSCRAYRNEPVSRSDVERILEAARLAPSACNRQPWRFAVATEAELRARLADEGILPGLGMGWIAQAPVILVLGMKKSFLTHRVAPLVSKVDYSLMDLGIAGEHAVLQAAELGLGTCWIGWIRPPEIRRILDWPADVVPQALITVGWPAARPARATPRLALDEIVTWR